MYKPTEPERPSDPTDSSRVQELDATRPSSSESTRLPLPGELRESPPLTRERRERADRDPQDDLMDS